MLRKDHKVNRDHGVYGEGHNALNTVKSPSRSL